MIRKMGGFSFQELSLTIDDIKTMSADGTDLSYDFILIARPTIMLWSPAAPSSCG